MSKVLVSVYPWENPKLYVSSFDLTTGEKVIVATEYCNELGTVVSTDVETRENPLGEILRIATQRDREVYANYQKEKNKIIQECKEAIKKSELEIKLVDASVSLDGKQIIFAFTSDGRVDFRQLVKDLSALYKKSIRMQQIGSRDEARKLGGYGMCGRELCCVRFSGNMQSITTDMARVQQIAHRGSDRISGLCGRLMCCLAYEAEQYREMLVGMPEIGSVVKTSDGQGTVVEINAILKEIKVKLENGKYLNLKKEDIK
jgi:cell fate regulator YaaT (PSP1 superfamily)